jgi:hypothetical protein
MNIADYVIIKEGWLDAGKKGFVASNPIMLDQSWTVVVWVGDDDPSLIKTEALEVVTPFKGSPEPITEEELFYAIQQKEREE